MFGSRLKIAGTLLAMSSMLGTSVLAYLPPINFEAPNYVAWEMVDGSSGTTHAGWDLLAGIAEVSPSGEGLGGGQALRLAEAGPAGETRLRRDLDWDPAEGIAFVDFWIKPPANPAGSKASLYLNGSQVAFQLDEDGTLGEIWAYNGNDDADPAVDPVWYPLAPTFSLDAVEDRADSFMRLTLRHDVTHRVWDVFVDGKMAAANLGFEGRAGMLQSVDLFGSDVTDVPIGSLKGALSVGGDGSAAYSIPIDLPKGTADMEPKISLDYSSNGANGIAGLGWALNGLQQITRGGATLAKDGMIDGVDFDSNDRFFFNGERLVLIEGVYGEAGSIYRTELDSFARITARGQLHHGPEWWTVETKSGLTLTLGDAPEARVEKADSTEDPGGALSWSVTRVEDTLGNYFRVRYTRDDPSAGIPGEVLNQRVGRIEYTGNDNAGLAPYCAVDFVFESRPDVRSFYTAGVRQAFDKRLSQVVVSTDGHENHRYELGYLPSEQTGRSLLVSVGKKVSGQTMPPTVFTWKTTDHADPKWRELAPLDAAPYITAAADGNDPASTAEVDPAGEHVLHLAGDAWRGIPLDYPMTTSTVLEFEFRASPEPPLAMIGLDDDLQDDGNGRLFALLGSYPSALGGHVYQPAEPGGWQTIRIPVGQSYVIDAARLIVVSSADGGAGESWIRNLRVFENGADPGEPFSFGINFALPTLTENNASDFGFRFQDFDGDGYTDILKEEYNGRTLTGDLYELASDGVFLRGSAAGPVESARPLHPTPVLTKVAHSYWNMEAIRHGYIAPATDLDGDGVAEASYSDAIRRANGWGYESEHGFVSFSNGIWTAKPSFHLPFRSFSYGNYQRFGYFDYPDLTGDGLPDCVVTLQSGQIFDRTSGAPITEAAGRHGFVWRNAFGEGGGWERDTGLDPPFALDAAMIGKRFLDVNADGLSDFVHHSHANINEVWLNNGSGWVQQPAGSPLHMPEMISNTSGADMGTRIVDLNGDGLADVINKWKYGGYPAQPTRVHLGTGTGWHSFPQGDAGPWDLESAFSTFDKSWSSHPSRSAFADLNADGLVDLVDSKASRNLVLFNTGEAFWEADSGTYWADGATVSADAYGLPVPMFRDATAEYHGWNTGLFVDLNGDQVTDYISHTETDAPRVWINLRGPEVIDSVTDGFGKTLGIEYARLNDPAPLPLSDKPVYTPHDPAFDLPLETGHIALKAGGLVVSSLTEPDGLGGTRCTRRHYGDLRYDRENQTSLGFGWIEVHEASCTRAGEHRCRGFTRTEMKRVYPFAGSPERVETWVCIHDQPDPTLFPDVSSGVKLVGLEINTYSELTSGPPSIESGDIEIRRPVQTSSVVTKYDINDAQTLLSRVETLQSGFDEYGFVTSSTVTALDGSQTITTNSYDHYTDIGNEQWLLGRLSETIVTKTHPEKPLITKVSTFGYDTTTCLLTSETVEPSHLLSVTTGYSHDDYGNVIRTDTTADGGPRWTSTGYDARGRFPTSETNDLGTVEFHYDQQRALQTGTTDINRRTTTYIHDGYGTQIATYHPSRTKSAEITFHANNADLPAQIQSELNAHFITLKWARCAESSGAPCTTVYFDQVGREVVSETTVLTSAAPNFEKQYSLMLYDERGRLVKESNPFVLGDAIHYTEHSYDFLDRRILSTRPDLAVSGIVSIGREALSGYGPCVKTVTTNPLGRQLTRWTDQHGRTVQTVDASNQTTNFYHDVEGRLTRVAINGVDQIINSYDLLGNKLVVWDRSGGSSSSSYNGFGEVVSTTSARQQTTTTTYDSLGRVTSVSRPEGTYTTTYVSSGENIGAIARIDGPGGYEETFTYGVNDHDYGLITSSSTRQAADRPTYTNATAYDSLGQPVRATDAGGAVVETTYASGYPVFALETRLIATSDIPTGLNTLVSQAPTLTVSGSDLIATETLPHGITRTTITDARNGFLKSIESTGPGGTLQDHSYTWDLNGNLKSRIDGVNDETETFGYDSLDRLSFSQLQGQTSVGYGYDAKGNLVSKAGKSRTYDPDSYQAISASVMGESLTYEYDDAGFVSKVWVAGGSSPTLKRGYSWTSFGQLKSVTQTSAPALATFPTTGQFAPLAPGIPQETRFHASEVTATFDFDAAGNRARQVLTRTYSTQDQATVTTRYLGSYEREDHLTFLAGNGFGENKILHRHLLAGATYLKETDSSGTKLYLSVTLTDHIGSTDAVLRAEWDASQQDWKLSTGEPRAERQSFGAWGERREQSDWTASRTAAADPYQTTAVAENRGYTGHEMLDDFGLIHMNGRIYDPELGRMLSPDPYVQVPEFSQNFNRYSYVLNNPLSHTDSSGYFIDWIVAGIYAAVSAVVSAASTGIAAGAAVGGAIAGTAGAVIGGVIGGVIGLAAGLLVPTAFMQGAGGLAIAGNLLLSAYNIGSQISAGGGWGDILRGVGVNFVSAAITVGLSAGGYFDNYLVRAAGHGIIQGSANEAMGGRFEDGFIGAAAGSLLPAFQLFSGPVGGTVNRAIVGGTASVIGGGKFANGAVSAAAAYLFDQGTLGTDERNQNETQGRWIHPFGNSSLSEGVTVHGILGDAPDADYQDIANRTGRSIFHIYSEGGLSGGTQDVLEVVTNRLTLGFGSRVTGEFLAGFSGLPPGARLDIKAHSQGTAPVAYAMLRRPGLFRGGHFEALSPAVYRTEIAIISAIAGSTYNYSMPGNDIARLYATVNPVGIMRAIANPGSAVQRHIDHGNTLPGFPLPTR